MKHPKSYTINTHDKTITLHRPMTENDLCRELLRDGYGDLVERVKWRPSEESIQIIRDAGKPMERECEWHLDDEEHGIWESACGESWSFVDGGPAENRMMYCHRCGGKLREKNGETK